MNNRIATLETEAAEHKARLDAHDRQRTELQAAYHRTLDALSQAHAEAQKQSREPEEAARLATLTQSLRDAIAAAPVTSPTAKEAARQLEQLDSLPSTSEMLNRVQQLLSTVKDHYANDRRIWDRGASEYRGVEPRGRGG